MSTQAKAPEIAATDARAAATAALRDVFGIENVSQLAEMATAINVGRQKLDAGQAELEATERRSAGTPHPSAAETLRASDESRVAAVGFARKVLAASLLAQAAGLMSSAELVGISRACRVGVYAVDHRGDLARVE